MTKIHPTRGGLSLTYFIAIPTCVLFFVTTAFGQPNINPDEKILESEVTVPAKNGPLQPIWGHASQEDPLQDLPSYRMAKGEDVEAVDYRQALPIPSTQNGNASNLANTEQIAEKPVVDVQGHQNPRSMPVQAPHSKNTASHTSIVEKAKDVSQDKEPEAIPAQVVDWVSEPVPEFPLPKTVNWSSPQGWSRLELHPAQRAQQDLAKPLQRYEPLFQHEGPFTPSSLTHPYGTVPLVLNRHVERNLNYFQTGISERFQGYLDRYEKYKDLVQRIFVEFGLPPELGYLSLVESGFNPRAYSRARASGPWQFMKATGRMYGLKVTWYVDERRDPVKSTIAAAHHLRDLYDQFGSWPLALGAYNAGGGKISRAIRRTGSRDFWKIRRTWSIRRETKEYVPRFIAATLIASNPSDYGFLVNPTQPYAYDEVQIHKRVHLKAIAKTTGISFDDLRELNPELRRSIVPNLKRGYALKVPVGMGQRVKERHDHIQPWTQPPPPATTWYRVRYGDSLSVVAKRFGMKVRALKNLNRLSGNLIRVGDRLRVRANDTPVDLKSRWYTVRGGDNLSDIAKKFGTTANRLKRLNSLSGNLIHVGDRLQVRGKAQPSRPRGDKRWYRVRQGDSLWKIARRFSVSVTDLKVLNNLTTSAIRAGHLLLVSR